MLSILKKTFVLLGLIHLAPVAANEPTVVGFTTEDGVQLAASFLPADGQGKAPAVILLHMFRSDRSAWKPLATALRARGITSLAIDLRGHGDSTQPTSMNLSSHVEQRDPEVFNEMYRDVMAAYAWLAEQPNVDLSRFGVIGASVGCSVALDYARRDRSVDAIVCMTPGTNYLGVDSISHVIELSEQGKRSILLLATKEEIKAAEELGRNCPSAAVEMTGPGKIHGTRMFGQIEGIEDRIIDYLSIKLGQASLEEVTAVLGGKEYFAKGSKIDIQTDKGKRRLFSSSAEASQRGLTPAKSPEGDLLFDAAIHGKSKTPRVNLGPGVPVEDVPPDD